MADDLATTAGEGKVEAATLTELKNELKYIADEMRLGVAVRRSEAEDTIYCRWPDQSPKGIKDKEIIGRDPFPFDGASDARVRLADRIINRRVMLKIAAIKRCTVKVKGIETLDGAFAGKMHTLLKWVISSKLGRNFWRELRKIARWEESDEPAGALLGVTWNYETKLERAQVTLYEVIQMWLEQHQKDPTDPTDPTQMLMMCLHDPEMSQQACELLGPLFPNLKPTRLKKLVADLRKDDKAIYPKPYVISEPELSAHRWFDDAFMRVNVRTLSHAGMILVREWVTKFELLERENSHGYSSTFITKALKHEGSSVIPDQGNPNSTGDVTSTIYTNKDRYAGLYEIWTAYRKTTDEDGIPGIYVEVFHHAVDEAAKDRELLDYKHGEYPCVDFWRETLTNRLMDSRSTAQLAMTDQEALKRQVDTFSDHTSITVLPSIFTPMDRPRMGLVLGPLREVPRRRPTDYEFMKPPEYPQASEAERQAIMRRVAEYFGLPHKELDPNEVVLQMQDMVDNFLASLADVYWMLIQLCQQYLSDEEITRIVGGNGIPIARNLEEIQGKFDLELSFDVRDLDLEYLGKLLSMVTGMSQLDTQATIQRDKLVQRLFAAVDPNLAEDTLTDVATATANEVDDEENNFLKIMGGIEPEMQEKGQNWAARLQVLEGIPKKFPWTLPKLDAVSQELYKRRMAHLQFQLQQEKNAITGKVGVKQLGE